MWESIQQRFSRYQQWRRGIPNLAFFFLVWVELTLLGALWASAGFLTVIIVAAPLFFGETYGLAVWVLVFFTVCGLGALNDRNR